jgi:hypothetical protein
VADYINNDDQNSEIFLAVKKSDIFTVTIINHKPATIRKQAAYKKVCSSTMRQKGKEYAPN